MILLAAMTVAAQPADSLETQPADSLSAEYPGEYEGDETGDDEDGLGERGRRAERRGPADSLSGGGFGHWLLSTSPNVQVKFNRRKDVSDWNTKIALRKRLSSKVGLKLSATLHTKENSTLNRSDSNDGTTASLNYDLNESITFALRYNSSLSANRYSLEKDSPAQKRRKQDVNVSAEFSKQLTPALSVRLGTTAGSTRNSYSDVSNEGSRQDLTGSISFDPMSNLKTSITYNAKRLLLDSKVDSSGSSVFTSKDRTFSDDLAATVTYIVMPGVRIGIDAARGDNQKQHPDPKEKRQETESRTSRRAAANAAFELIKRFTWDLSVGISDSETRFVVKSDRNNAISNSTIKGSARLLPWRGATVNLGAAREATRSEYLTPDTGRDLHKSLTLKLRQDLGSKVNLNLTALSDIVSVLYDNKEENPKDRDRVNNRLSVDLTYKPLDNITTTLGGDVSDDQTVYVKSERSASNRTTRRYRLTGSYDLRVFRGLGLSQNYDISALYTFFHYDDDNLVRNSNISTRCKIALANHVDLNINHDYKFQDQGGYSEDGGSKLYARSADRESHVLSAVCRYKPVKAISLVVRHTYRIQRNWTYREGQKRLDYETETSEITGRMRFKYEFGDRTDLALTVEQNLKEGSTVNEAFRNYRNIQLEASHVF
jgi:hypothetical protein